VRKVRKHAMDCERCNSEYKELAKELAFKLMEKMIEIWARDFVEREIMKKGKGL